MEFVEIYSTWNEQKAGMIKELLGDYDIECYLSSHITHSVYPIPVDGLGEIKVMVPLEEEQRSRDLIGNFFSREDEESN